MRDPAIRTFRSVLAETGARIGEVLALRPQDVDVARGTLSIHQSVYAGSPQDPKTPGSIRSLSISPWLVDQLEEALRRRTASGNSMVEVLARQQLDRPRLIQLVYSGER